MQKDGFSSAIRSTHSVITASHLVKTLLFQPFAKNFSNAGKSRDRFFTHGLSHKIFMFLGC